MFDSDPKAIVSALSDLLGTEKGDAEEARPPTSGTNSLSCSKRKNDQIEFSCPALSLVHDDHLHFDHGNRAEAEQSAFQLLSRPMGFECRYDSQQTVTEKLAAVASVILMNISESFALLVDSRVRAHASFLEEHGISAHDSPEHSSGSDLIVMKLQRLLELSDLISASHVKTSFEVGGDPVESEEGKRHECEVTFKVSMQLFIGSASDSPSDALSIQFDAPGSLSVCSRVDSGLRMVQLRANVDIHRLLGQMKECASDVVARVVEVTNSLFVGPDLQRSKSAQAPHHPASTTGKSSRRFSLVSSDAAACRRDFVVSSIKWRPREVPGQADAGDLSPDQCADVLDGVFGGVDNKLFNISSISNDQQNNEQPHKRAKTSA